jgi:hypothetical protein
MGARRGAAVTPQRPVAHGWRSGLPLRSAPNSSTMSESPGRSACSPQVTGPPASSQQARAIAPARSVRGQREHRAAGPLVGLGCRYRSGQARGLPLLGARHDVIAPIGAAVDAKRRLLGLSDSPQPDVRTGERASERTM